jgi:hypothetical protein
MYDRNDLTWKDDKVYRQGSTKPVIAIEADGRYPGMWRVRRPNGRLGDMTNKTRAKDAAASIALGILNAGETTVAARSIDYLSVAATP